MVRSAPRHDRDAGGPADVLAAKAALREDVWSAMRSAKVARFPGAAGRIPNFTGAEAAAERLRGLLAWQHAAAVKANPDSAQLPVRQRALEDGKMVYMAVPRLAEPEPFFALDPDHLDQPPRKAASIGGASRSARRVRLDELTPVDLVVMGSVAVGEDGARLGKGGGFADLEFALATAAGLIGPHTVAVTTVHEIQVRPAGTIPLTSHDALVDYIVTPERVIDCRPRHGPRPDAGIQWDDLTEEKIAAIPLLSALRAAARLPQPAGQVHDAGQHQETAGGRCLDALAQCPVVHVDAGRQPVLVVGQVLVNDDVPLAMPDAAPVRGRHPERAPVVPRDERDEVHDLAPPEVLPQPPVERAGRERRPVRQRAGAGHRHDPDLGEGHRVIPEFRQPAEHREHGGHLAVSQPAEQRAVTGNGHAPGENLPDHAGNGFFGADFLVDPVGVAPGPEDEKAVFRLGEDVVRGSSGRAVHQDHGPVRAVRVVRGDGQRIAPEQPQTCCVRCRAGSGLN
jgi:5-formyltetrahydrofolate cyclo-ligase